MTDKKTKHLNLPLPDAGNALAEDCPRLAQALTALDDHAQTADDRLDSVEIRASALEATLQADIEAAYAALEKEYKSTGETL